MHSFYAAQHERTSLLSSSWPATAAAASWLHLCRMVPDSCTHLAAATQPEAHSAGGSGEGDSAQSDGDGCHKGADTEGRQRWHLCGRG